MMTSDELREFTGLLVALFDADHIEDVGTARAVASALAADPVLTLLLKGASFKNIMSLPAAAAALSFHKGPRNKGREILLRGLPIELVARHVRYQLRELAEDEQGNFFEIVGRYGVACAGCGETMFFDTLPEGRVPWKHAGQELHHNPTARLLALEGAPTRHATGLSHGECLKETHSAGKQHTWQHLVAVGSQPRTSDSTKTNMWRSFVTGEWHCDGPNKLKRCDVCFKLTSRTHKAKDHKRTCTAQDAKPITFTYEEGPWPVGAYQRCPPCRSE